MKDNYNNIDELLRESLKDYKKEPSAGVWNKISIRLFLSGAGRYLSVIIFLIAIITGTFIYLNFNNTEEELKGAISETSDMISPEKFTDQTPGKADKSNKIINNQKQESPEVLQEKESDTEFSEIADVDVIKSSHDKANGSVAEIKDKTTDLPESQINHFDVYPGLIRLNNLEKIGHIEISKSFFSSLMNHNRYIKHIDLRYDYKFNPSVPKDDYGRKGAWTYGLFITPELIFINNEKNSKKKALNIDITGIYSRNDWFIQAGAGIALSEDNGAYRIDYAQYDSIGYYYEVTSFNIDPETGEPVFKTTVENVYDTVDYNTTKSTNNLYTYFRLPVFVGFKVNEYKRLLIYLKGGAIYSILLKSNEPGVDYANEKATRIKITDETPGRIQSYWQLSAAIGFSYSLTNNLSLSAEPVFNYYMKPVYEQRVYSKSPYAIGLRIGMIFKF
ncbi:MAG: hypothetical protein K8R37_11580 [Bacteroidales bacterium]|nr:hypothetical protein [Bacteroidales bacterium]